MDRKKAGSRAEAAAAAFLERQGYAIIGRNIRYPFGELDIVAFEGRAVVFVEVRSSGAGDIGRPLESINTKKMERITRAAFRFLQDNPEFQKYPVRFDCIIVTDLNYDPQISWIKSAFEPVRL